MSELPDPAAPNLHDVDHLRADLVGRVHRDLARKALSEWSHERLLEPEPDPASGPDRWLVRSDDGRTTYRFAARRRDLDHWLVDAASLTRERDGAPLPLDVQDLVVDVRARLGLGEHVLPVYLDELNSTLYGGAWKLTRGEPSAKDLATADHQTIEATMSEGHPCFVACNGRIGFGADDYRAYAPETGRTLHLVWLAMRRDRSVFAAADGLEHDDLVAAELSTATRDRFVGRLAALGLDPGDYHLLPVHPWQWRDRLAVTFASDLAAQDLVLLGPGDDEHRPQQSIRTFANATNPRRHYVKTSLSILNMGFVRGLSTAYMSLAPTIDSWLHDLVDGDDYLRARGFTVLREVAATGYRRRHEDALPAGSPHRKMLAALWRQSSASVLEPGERAMTTAALLHRDPDGQPLVLALVEASGLDLATWLRQWLDAHLAPLAHCVWAHDLAFMPHGENVILVVRDGVPVRTLMKDTGEEVCVMNTDDPLPDGVGRIQHDVSDEARALAILTDVVDCFLRHLDGLLAEHVPGWDADVLWAAAAGCLADYQREHPELAERFARVDLFADDFELVCLNRLQLADNTAMVDLAEPDVTGRTHGRLANPLARFRPEG